MKALIQRVKTASVTVENKLHSEIGKGILVLLGVEKDDMEADAAWLADKIIALRMFEDENDKMNHSITDIGGEILVVSQFTLLGDCKKGTRPSFDKAAPPETAEDLYEKFIKILINKNMSVKSGVFRAMMDVSLVNWGPMTFMLEHKSH